MAAATLAQEQTLSLDIAFIQRVQMALVTAAINVQSEPTTTLLHAQRVVYAQRILANPILTANQMAVGVATNTTIGTEYVGPPIQSSNILDADIQFTVNSLYNAYL